MKVAFGWQEKYSPFSVSRAGGKGGCRCGLPGLLGKLKGFPPDACVPWEEGNEMS